MIKARFSKPAALLDVAFAPNAFASGNRMVLRSRNERHDDFLICDEDDAADGRAAPQPKIAFLFNAQTHQLLHGITIAEELATRWNVQVDILSASSRHLKLARAIVRPRNRSLLHFEQLGSRLLHGLAALTGSVVPPKVLTLFDARRRLDSYAAIALPERTSTIMRRFGVTRPRLIHVDHGAGDRAAGFDPRIAQFDFAMLAGEKQRRRMLDEGLIRHGAHEVVGYPKFEAADRLRDPCWSPFADPKPVILYNPHFSSDLGSWTRDGMKIVDAVVRDGRYNLIFAPHIRMCDSRAKRKAMLAALKPYLNAPNLHIDLGSRRSIDMTYTMLADVYVGDVSSQIYEYLRHPRPALFINSHYKAWQDDENYAHWRFGPVIWRGEDIIAGIDRAIADHRLYRNAQIRAFTNTFTIDRDESCSIRAAAAIAAYLGLEPAKTMALSGLDATVDALSALCQ